ncbi:class I SAM-dependent methyltransferase [Saccharopolyspora sp. K220]|uniref:class I SAM-dependent methyltransferase n=1 Tax=Saccharopolyspora soli TaxID=2926618 RepID=UPI001F57CDE9|nr:class I SAM-dependent methyltransferase [Saccharopolyspora soli]MCI2416702.1 class I SAM-dependent methyltransferase [Saccharopolyspora soli]
MDDLHPKEVVRRGYDAVSYHYRRDDADDGQYAPWIARLSSCVPARADILDLGCGCGVPVARSLARAGHAVTGVDFSAVQVRRARNLVPEATFIQADATGAAFPAASFDAIVCLYMFIHLPLDEQPPLFARIAIWLRPGGWLLVTTGHGAWTGSEPDWLGSGATMWWSHVDSATYRAWISTAGFGVVSDEFVPEGAGGHTLFWAKRR